MRTMDSMEALQITATVSNLGWAYWYYGGHVAYIGNCTTNLLNIPAPGYSVIIFNVDIEGIGPTQTPSITFTISYTKDGNLITRNTTINFSDQGPGIRLAIYLTQPSTPYTTGTYNNLSISNIVVNV